MEIVLKNSVSSITLEKFAEDNQLKLIVCRRSIEIMAKKYYVYLEGIEISKGGMLLSSFGDGNTIDEAIEEYKKIISNKKLVINAMAKNRKEFNLPKII